MSSFGQLGRGDCLAVQHPTTPYDNLYGSLATKRSTCRAAFVQSAGPLPFSAIAGKQLLVYPKGFRRSYADQVLALLRERGVKSASIYEVRELQTALGLFAAGSGFCIVPAGVKQFRCGNVVYCRIDDSTAV